MEVFVNGIILQNCHVKTLESYKCMNLRHEILSSMVLSVPLMCLKVTWLMATFQFPSYLLLN